MIVDFPRLKDAINAGMETGLHIGAVVHVRQHGEAIADFAIGAASLEPFAELRPDQRLLWLSAGKPLTALAVGILADRGRISFDDPVARHIPDFAQNGKDEITLRNLLTHTHAYKPPPLDWPRMSRDAIIEKICTAQPIPGTLPGEYAAYDPQSGWYLLSEIIYRATGIASHEFVKSEILGPLGLADTSIGMSAEEWRTARDSGNLAVLYDTTGSAREKVDLRSAASGNEPPQDHPDHIHHPTPWVGDDAQRAPAHNPGGGAVGTARDMAALYQFLLDGGKNSQGTALLRPETIQQMTTRQRVGLKDNSFGQVIDWGLGFLINSAMYGSPAVPYGYGRFASDETFGHGGMQSSAGFCDPENGLAVSIIFNGLPGEPKHQKRVLEVNSALYEDLGLGS